MNPLFQPNTFVIKRKKLSTDKLRVFSETDQFLMYAEQKIKWTPPFTATLGIWADEQKQQEILHVTDAGGREYKNFLEVTDPVAGDSVGGIGFDMGFIKDGWHIMDTAGQPLAVVREPSFGRSIARQLSGGMIAQKLDVVMGEATVATFQQKHALVGNKLVVQIRPEASLDHRLLIAAAVLIAAYQAKEDLD